MRHKGQTTTLEERVTIAERVRAGQSSREIAEVLERPLPTLRLGEHFRIGEAFGLLTIP